MLLDYLREINRLTKQPTWYKALLHNCTTTIRLHSQHIGEAESWDWRILLNGRLDKLGYEREWIDTGLPFPEIRIRSDITEKANAAYTADDISRCIRVGLPNPL